MPSANETHASGDQGGSAQSPPIRITKKSPGCGQFSGPGLPSVSTGRNAPILARRAYFRIASLNALAARKRTTVFALILIGSPVCGLRPMRALRCALTARPRFGITNLPAPPLHSFTASLNSSSKNAATVFFGVPLFRQVRHDLRLAQRLCHLISFSSSKLISSCSVSPHEYALGRARATL